jgi:hypothetical protein
MSRFRLVDAGTGMVIRHSVRTLREADRERDWYEQATGRSVRIIKLFKTDAPEDDSSGARG